MIIALLVILLIVGFMIADAILDYIFVIVYALLFTMIADHLLHAFRYYRKYHKACSDDVRGVLLYAGLALLTTGLRWVLFDFRF